MAIDFNEVFESLHSMQIKIDDIRSIAQLAKDGNLNVPYIGTIGFTTSQRGILKTEYDRLKAEIIELWQSLP